MRSEPLRHKGTEILQMFEDKNDLLNYKMYTYVKVKNPWWEMCQVKMKAIHYKIKMIVNFL